MENSHICVITRDQVCFARPSGTIALYDILPAGTLWHAGKLMRDTANAFGSAKTGLLIVPTTPGPGYDLLDDSPANAWRQMEAAAMEMGFAPTGNGDGTTFNRGWETGWGTFAYGDNQTLIMGVLDLIDQSRTPLFDIAAKAETITEKLVAYHAVTGALWRMTAGVSGCVGIRADRAARATSQLTLVGSEAPAPVEPHWRWDKAPEGIHGAGFTRWTRTLFPAEKHCRIATFDIRNQYLASMISANQGWGEPTRKPSSPFEPERAGFWQVGAKALLALDGPPLIKNVDERGLTWVTTRVMTYLFNAGINPLVYDSWTAATSGQLLKPWATRIRNGLYEKNLADLWPALKRTYAETNGMLAVPGGSIFRPDWHWTNVDTAAINMRVKIDRVKTFIGVWPVRVHHDAVSYAIADDAALKELSGPLGVGPGIGKFKLVSVQGIQEWNESVLKGANANG